MEATMRKTRLSIPPSKIWVIFLSFSIPIYWFADAHYSQTVPALHVSSRRGCLMTTVKSPWLLKQLHHYLITNNQSSDISASWRSHGSVLSHLRSPLKGTTPTLSPCKEEPSMESRPSWSEPFWRWQRNQRAKIKDHFRFMSWAIP